MKYTRESFIRALGVSVMPDEFGIHFEETMAEYDELGAPYLSDEFLENIQNEFDLFEVKYDFVKKEIARVRESDLLCRYSMLMKRMMVDKDEMALITLPVVPRGSTEEETVDLEMAAFFAQLAFLPDMAAYYRERGLPEKIIRDTLNDAFEGGIRVCYGRFARDGYEINRSFMWNQHYLDHRIIRVGVLNFEMKRDFTDAVRIFVNKNGKYVILSNGQSISSRGQITGSGADPDEAFVAEFKETYDSYEGYEVDSVNAVVTRRRVFLSKAEWRPAINPDDHVLNVHIPESKDFCRETVEEAYRECCSVVERCFPEFKPRAITCFSWLLEPRLRELLREGSNILAFQLRYKLFPMKSTGKAPYSFLFRCPYDTKPEDLPEETSLQRKVKALYKAGEYLYAPGGVIFLD